VPVVIDERRSTCSRAAVIAAAIKDHRTDFNRFHASAEVIKAVLAA
jgi:hypothetical protein